MGEDQQEGVGTIPSQGSTLSPTVRSWTLAMLPSNLMICDCSQFHSDWKGAMRKVEQGVRRKNKSDEDCYRPQRPPQSRWGSLCFTSTETMLTKTSECNHLTFSKGTECSQVGFWQCRALRQICSADSHGLCPVLYGFILKLLLPGWQWLAIQNDCTTF